jgi:Multicopper oxidase
MYVRKFTSNTWSAVAAITLVALHALPAKAAAPGITGPTFNLDAQPNYLNQPDGAQVYAWGYGCTTAPAGFAPAAITNAKCNTMQVPGPTLIVTEGQTVTVTLTNGLPSSAGNTSILFPGFQVTSSGGVTGLLTQEAPPGGTVTYTFTATSPGTRSYYSGTQSDLQVEMGLYGAIIVLPVSSNAAIANCSTGLAAQNVAAQVARGESDFRLAHAAYDNPKTCYDREYLFQFAEMDVNIHRNALAQVTATAGCTAGAPGCSLEVPTEPYHPGYFLINGRSMPDDMDANYGAEYPHQPYNGNPHMHPGEQTLIRVIGQDRCQQPCRTLGVHHHDDPRRGIRWNLLLDRQGFELGCVRSQSRIHRSQRQAELYAGCQRLQHRVPCVRSDIQHVAHRGDRRRHQLLRMVPGPQQAAGGCSVWRCGGRRSCDSAEPEHLRERRLV